MAEHFRLILVRKSQNSAKYWEWSWTRRFDLFSQQFLFTTLNSQMQKISFVFVIFLSIKTLSTVSLNIECAKAMRQSTCSILLFFCVCVLLLNRSRMQLQKWQPFNSQEMIIPNPNDKELNFWSNLCVNNADRSKLANKIHERKIIIIQHS